MLHKILCGVVAVSLLACSAAPFGGFKSRPKAPAREHRLPFEKGDRRFYMQWVHGFASPEEAHGMAMQNVLTQEIAQELGVRIESENVSEEVESDGSYRYRVSSRQSTKVAPVDFSSVRLEDRYEECGAEGSNGSCSGYVLVSVPKEELRAVRRTMLGRVGLVLVCDQMNGSRCPKAVEDAVRAAASKAGLALTDQALSEEQPAMKIGDLLDCAQTLNVRISLQTIGQESGVWYMKASGSANLVETRHGKTLVTVDADEEKFGGYTEDACRQVALKKTGEKLAGDIETRMMQVPSH